MKELNKTGFVPTFSAHNFVESHCAGRPVPQVLRVMSNKGIAFSLEISDGGQRLAKMGDKWLDHGEWTYQSSDGIELSNPFCPIHGIAEVRTGEFNKQNPTSIICMPRKSE